MSEYESAGYEPRERGASPNPIYNYFGTLKAILTRPTAFFRGLPRPTGFVGPLFFGILTSWFGSALEYLWYSGFGKIFGSRMTDLIHAFEKVPQIDSSGQFETALALREKVTDWVFGVGAVLIDPFKTCAWILFLSFFIWVGARLFANRDYAPQERRLSYETALSIAAYAQAAALFKGVPILGGMIAAIFAMVIGVIGATETYRVTTGRAIVIALFPTILFWGLLIAGVVAFFSAILMLVLH
jgi:hypothetical protein